MGATGGQATCKAIGVFAVSIFPDTTGGAPALLPPTLLYSTFWRPKKGLWRDAKGGFLRPYKGPRSTTIGVGGETL